MKLVKFKNGNYGIRRGFIFHEFVSDNGFWWSKSESKQIKLEHTQEEAERLFNLLSDKGEPVK